MFLMVVQYLHSDESMLVMFLIEIINALQYKLNVSIHLKVVTISFIYSFTFSSKHVNYVSIEFINALQYKQNVSIHLKVANHVSNGK